MSTSQVLRENHSEKIHNRSEAIGKSFEITPHLTLKNRIVKSSTEELLSNERGEVTSDLISLYHYWGQRGAGMILSGNMFVNRQGVGRAGNVVIKDTPEFKARFKELARIMKQGGSAGVIQINHAGRQALRDSGETPVAPSAVEVQGFKLLIKKPVALEEEQIEEIVQDFARTARIVKECGFDGVQIHGAHGYLISQFLSPKSNLRDDKWGGTIENRSRFLFRIIEETRKQVGDNFMVGVKLNSADFQRGGFSPEDSLWVSSKLAISKVDFLEILGGNYESPAMMGKKSTMEREAYFLEFAERIRSVTSIPLIVTGGFRSSKGIAAALQSGAMDLAGVARPFVVEEDFVDSVLKGNGFVDPKDWTDRTGYKWADKVLAIAWYKDQIAHTAKYGHPIGPKANPYKALVSEIARNLF